MDQSELRADLLGKKGATEETPFGPDALVYKQQLIQRGSYCLAGPSPLVRRAIG